jgi:hypothetical protein
MPDLIARQSRITKLSHKQPGAMGSLWHMTRKFDRTVDCLSWKTWQLKISEYVLQTNRCISFRHPESHVFMISAQQMS